MKPLNEVLSTALIVTCLLALLFPERWPTLLPLACSVASAMTIVWAIEARRPWLWGYLVAAGVFAGITGWLWLVRWG